MKPVLVLQHLDDDGPGVLASWLADEGIPFDLSNASAGQSPPADLAAHAALVILGGAWSANDDRPALRQAEALVREAMNRGLPVLGHCLGGQLMSRALGRRVGPSPAPERGWHQIDIEPAVAARHWFGPIDSARVFQWHSESFELPERAVRLAGNAACPNQAWSMGPHLAMQFHVEVDAAKLEAWCDDAEHWPWPAGQGAATVHDAARMRAETADALEASQALAARLYRQWASALRS